MEKSKQLPVKTGNLAKLFFRPFDFLITSTDIGQQTNLAEAEPEKLQEMMDLYDALKDKND